MDKPQQNRIALQIDEHVATLTIDRPEKLNAFDSAMVDELVQVCRRIEHAGQVRAVIIIGSGSKTFSAGGDIKAWSSLDPHSFGRFWLREGHDAFAALARLRQPVIAVLNGHALGGGLEFAALADLRIAEEHAKIGQPETGLGIIPGWSGTQRAVRRFGPQIVRRMALFGEVFSATDALACGLVDEVVATGAGLDRARAVAQRVASRGPVATEITKMLINAAEGEERERAMESMAGALAASSEDLKEGVAAFLTKRPPVFSGR